MNPTSLGFGLVYAGQLLYSEVLIDEGFYRVLFNSKQIAEITYTFNFEWKLSAGALLPQSIVDEIGYRIENHYD